MRKFLERRIVMLSLDFPEDFSVSVEVVDNLYIVEEKLQLTLFLNQKFNNFISESSTNLIALKKHDMFQMLGIEATLENGLFRFLTSVEIKLNSRPETLIVTENHLDEDGRMILTGIVRMVFGDLNVCIFLQEETQSVIANMSLLKK